MLKLPQFTFILNAPSGDLAEALVKEANACPVDFEEPLRNSTQLLFWDSFSPNRDLTKPEERAKPLPGHTMSVEAYLQQYANFLEFTLGVDYRGRILFEQMKQDLDDDMFDSYVFRDAQNFHELQPFLNHAGPKQCLFVSFKMVPAAINEYAGSTLVYLPDDSTPDNLIRIEKVLRG